jgi:hypothetical protein
MKNKRIFCLLLAVFFLLLLSSNYAGNPKTGEEINWQVISNGGTNGSSANLILKGTTGQTAVKRGTSASYELKHGFWQIFGTTCQGLCGDANNDNSVNVSDAVHITNYVFIGGGEPQPVMACGDANTDGGVNISDAVWITNYVFVGGGPPSTCSPGSPNWHNGDCCPF